MTGDTYTADLYVGLREGRTATGRLHAPSEVYAVVKAFAAGKGIGLCLTPCRHFYDDQEEQGVVVRLFNYPLLPRSRVALRELALDLGQQLVYELRQTRLNIVFPDRTITLFGDGFTGPGLPWSEVGGGPGLTGLPDGGA